jgi:hypothetical protein
MASIAVVTHYCRVSGVGLPGEVRQLRRGHSFNPAGSVAEIVGPPQVIELPAEVRPRRPLRRALQPVEAGLPARPGRVQQGLQPGRAGATGATGDSPEKRGVDLTADP